MLLIDDTKSTTMLFYKYNVIHKPKQQTQLFVQSFLYPLYQLINTLLILVILNIFLFHFTHLYFFSLGEGACFVLSINMGSRDIVLTNASGYLES